MEEQSNETLMADPVLLDALKTWRSRLASEHSLPPYVIAHDKALQAVAAMKPTNDKQLLDVPGFGTTKVEKYGADIYKLVGEHAQKA